MALESDELDKALRENLKLRSELAAEVAKEKQGGGIAYRLGWVLYWASIVSIALWCAYALLEINRVGLPRTGGEFGAGDAIWLVSCLLYLRS